MENLLLLSSRLVHPCGEGLSRPLAEALRAAEKKLGDAWAAMPEPERAWYRVSGEPHTRPGVLLREVVNRHGPQWELVFEGMSAVAAVAEVATGKRRSTPALSYLSSAPEDLSRRARTMRKP